MLDEMKGAVKRRKLDGSLGELAIGEDGQVNM